MYTQTTAIIRDRWQLTIPDEIRKIVSWAKPQSVVSFRVTAKNELMIKPFELKQEREVNWGEVWKAIREARIISSKGKKVSLSQFIIEDRERR
ncbi:MAG: hypothetical protein AAB929_04895 [Patescibacteria group bacterium]